MAGFQDVVMQLLRCSEGFLTCCYPFAKGRVILAIAMEMLRFCEWVWSGF